MNIIESYLTKNPGYAANVNKTNSKYTAFQTNGAQGLMLHSVGCSQPSASVFVNSWNKSTYTSACVHGFIDGNTGDVYQTLPWNYRGWHCGSTANNTHIGVEMCEPSTIKYTTGASFTVSNLADAQAVATRTYNAAVELFAYLCGKLGLDPLADGVIISHKEGYKRGVASNHGDPEHLWKGLSLPYTMDTFRAAVAAAMGTSTEGSSKETTEGVTGESDIVAGAEVVLATTPLYSTATAKTASSTKTGTDYIWSAETVSGRVRITNTKERVGVSGQVTGWVNVSDISATAVTHTVVKGDTLSALAKKYGTTVAKIVAANTAKYPKITASYIVVGWVLTIPEG